jgi:hypothetical protein
MWVSVDVHAKALVHPSLSCAHLLAGLFLDLVPPLHLPWCAQVPAAHPAAVLDPATKHNCDKSDHANDKVAQMPESQACASQFTALPHPL